MSNIDLNIERALAEEKISGDSFDFTAKYFAVYELRNIAEKRPEIIREETILILEKLFKHKKFAGQRQGFFLFRETANTLSTVLKCCNDIRVAENILAAFKRILVSVSSHAHRAAAEALGALPVSISGPCLPDLKIDRILSASLQEVMEKTAVASTGTPIFLGRSLVIPCSKTKRLLVLKLARDSDTPKSLAKEILWMDYLRSAQCRFTCRFDIPETVFIGNSPVFSLKTIPIKSAERLHPKKYAIAFSAPPDYFTYPNEPESAQTASGDHFKEIIFRNARLAGKLASEGVIHSALIPLFHNRVQRGRRRDHGLYEWFRAGRLDRWLRSCDHPNLGPTGLRDFEHFSAFNEKGLSLYRCIGNQFLSFLLVAGSYFRNKSQKTVGFDPCGNPVDARFLFNKDLLEEIISGIFQNYYFGFTGISDYGRLPFDTGQLASRMIDEMGVDRHMEEILRVADQNEMSDDQFQLFLKQRGFADSQISTLVKGEKEIIIHSGPHLGGFNERISIPELIEAVAAMSGLCIGGKFWQQHFKQPMRI
ncbi:MAG: SidJ-related pseudokinase [Desulfobacterales bacterium]